MSRRNRNFPSSTMSQQQHFSQVPKADIKRSRIDRSHGHKTTFGVPVPAEGADTRNPLVPIYVDEVLPGDSFHMKSTMFARLATPLHPIMDNLFLDVHFFYVPNRLVWEDWQKFMGERENPNDDPSDYTVPQALVRAGTSGAPQSVTPHSLSSYFGLPMMVDDEREEGEYMVNALPFRAYRLIWNEWYRDENLQDSVEVNRTSVPDPSLYTSQPLPRGKRKDYFTGALPWPQKGDPVHIPIESPSDVVDGEVEILGGTINDLRTAFQIQKLLERDARGGTRYTELIQSHFGVTSPDSRLQRPEYLGGSSSRIGVSPVANTAGETRPEGALGGVGTSVNQATFSKSFTEHGIIIGLASYRADLTYQRGIERFWSRETRYDYFWPALAHLGEQAILNKEINFRGVPLDDEVFAYQERYGEYRFKPSRITGLFNSDAPESLDVWHLAQDFPIDEPLPFNEAFIVEDPPIERTIAVPGEPYFIADIWFDLKCDRPMPIYSVPGFVDHF